MIKLHKQKIIRSHNPYFNRWFSAIKNKLDILMHYRVVTILILIDGFLQWWILKRLGHRNNSHNPYFNRWFSAMESRLCKLRAERLSQSLF